ncbi:hypothetical protein [Tropicimonas aquimaris]|uniref:Uncharacterized protein n=1 Tax=Tropicimonas aquimaris TaxID=914152 RepID=A0ABW3IVS5_9RHOB
MVSSDNAIVAKYAPAFFFPHARLAVGRRRHWRSVGGARIRWAHLVGAFGMVAKMKGLSAGHREACNFEEEERFSHARRHMHQFLMSVFLLSFAATSTDAVMHDGFVLRAPHRVFSLPKLLGVPVGLILAVGTGWMAKLKLFAEREVGEATACSGDDGLRPADPQRVCGARAVRATQAGGCPERREWGQGMTMAGGLRSAAPGPATPVDRS